MFPAAVVPLPIPARVITPAPSVWLISIVPIEALPPITPATPIAPEPVSN